MITFDDVRCSFDAGRTWAVDGLSLEVREGELLALLGESGSGKTTSLRLINRLAEPTGGRVLLEGQDVANRDPVLLRRNIGYAFQSVGLFPHWSVAQNIATVPRLLGWPETEVAARVEALLTLMGLPKSLAARSPATLSGGQAQRVGLARALAAKPKVMLLDEPFAALDPIRRESLQREYRQLHGALGLTTVLVTHDVTEALLMADRLAVMEQGKLLAAGAPAELAGTAQHPVVSRLLEMPRRQAEAVRERLAAM